MGEKYRVVIWSKAGNFQGFVTQDEREISPLQIYAGEFSLKRARDMRDAVEKTGYKATLSPA